MVERHEMLDASRGCPIQQAIQVEGNACTVSTPAVAQARDSAPRRVVALPGGNRTEIYRELAVQEDDHIAILETDRRNTRATLDAGAH